MTSRWSIAVGALFVVSACSGSDATTPDTQPASTDATDSTVSTDAVDDTTPPPVTEPADDAEPADTDSESSADVDDDDGDDGGGLLVIDGPAQVDLDDDDADEGDADDAEQGDDAGDIEAAPAGVACGSLPTGLTELALEGGGAVHDVRVYVPANVVADPAPVVLNWHGLGSNGPEQAVFSGYETLSEQEGFIAVHATGIANEAGSNSWELLVFDSPARDDLAFADVLIDTLIADWCVDPTRVYSTGMSNGGFFTSELVCNRSTRIAAAVSVAGVSHPDACEPERAVPYAAFHGTDDAVVPFAGGGESTLTDEVDPDGFFGQVMPDEFAEFAADAGCDPDPTRTEETPEVIRYDYVGCDHAVPMTFYELPGSGHTWPNSPLADALGGIGYFTLDIDASADGWAFMSQHTL